MRKCHPAVQGAGGAEGVPPGFCYALVKLLLTSKGLPCDCLVLLLTFPGHLGLWHEAWGEERIQLQGSCQKGSPVPFLQVWGDLHLFRLSAAGCLLHISLFDAQLSPPAAQCAPLLLLTCVLALPHLTMSIQSVAFNQSSTQASALRTLVDGRYMEGTQLGCLQSKLLRRASSNPVLPLLCQWSLRIPPEMHDPALPQLSGGCRHQTFQS